MAEDEDSDLLEDLYVDVLVTETPARVGEPDDAIRHCEGRLFRWKETGDKSDTLATIEWMQVEYGYGVNHGVPGFEIADAHSQELHDLHVVLFDENEQLRPGFDELGGLGSDLLVIELVKVNEAKNFDVYAAELLEHVLRRWSQGCFAAVYIEDAEPAPRLAELLLARGFQWRKSTSFGLYLADLNAVRPELPGEVPRLNRLGPPPGSSTH